MQKIFEMPCIAKHVEPQAPVVHVPMTSMKGMYVDLWNLSFAENAKYGLVGRWPANHAYKAHFGSLLDSGFESHRESLEIKFDFTTVETDKTIYTIKPYSIGYVDGQNKAIIMISIMALLADLDPCQCAWHTFDPSI